MFSLYPSNPQKRDAAANRLAPPSPNWFDLHHLGFLNLVVYVFVPHSGKETEMIARGPVADIDDIDGLWPRPWLYSRAFLLFLIAFVLLYVCWHFEGSGDSSTLFPGMTIVGTLAFPLAMLLFLYECNKFRTLSLLSVFGYFLIGSCVSIAVTAVFALSLDSMVALKISIPHFAARLFHLRAYAIRPFRWINLDGSAPQVLNAVFEEFSKMLVIFILLMRRRHMLYILQGMLIGAAVGAGFAVFESAGYAVVEQGNFLIGILVRGLMAPACHTAWGAIFGGAAMLIAKRRLSCKILLHPLLWLVFLGICSLHILWNYLLEVYDTLTHTVQLSIFTWFILLMLIWAGVLQARRFKEDGYLPIDG